MGYAQSNDASYAASIPAARSVLQDAIGFNSSVHTFNMQDGSGLSRRNGVTVRAIADLLQAMARHDGYGEEFLDYFPIAGQDGTLASRFVGSPAQGILFAKTGSLTGVNALSGYVFPRHFDRVTFSIIHNAAVVSASTVRNAIDEVCILVAQLEHC